MVVGWRVGVAVSLLFSSVSPALADSLPLSARAGDGPAARRSAVRSQSNGHTGSTDTRARSTCNAARPQMRGNTTGTRATRWTATQGQADGSGCGCGAGHVVIAAALRRGACDHHHGCTRACSNRMEQRASCIHAGDATMRSNALRHQSYASHSPVALRPGWLRRCTGSGAPRCRLPFFVRRGTIQS